jgi:plasmid stability protein
LLSLLAKTTLSGQEDGIMGTLTIRNLDDPLKSRLRIRAAERNRSMEEEARQILRAALQEPAAATQDLGSRIRARFAGLGDVQLPIEPREPVRPPPALDAPAAAEAAGKRKVGTAPRRRR